MAVDPNYAYIWDVATVTCRLVLADHQFWVYSVAWSPDGSMVATGSHDYQVRVWDAATGSCLKTYKMESSSHVLSLAWSPDGTKLLAGLRDWGSELWDVTTDSFMREFNGKTDAKFSPDGNSVVTGPGSGVDDAMVWDAATGKKIAVFRTDGATCHKTAFMPDGKTIATASSSTVEVWDISTGKCLKKVEDLAYEINAFTVAPDGRSFFIDHADNTVKMWSLTDSTCIKTFKGHLQRVKGVAISPNGQSVITASEDRTARLWDLGNNRIATRPPTTSRKIPHAIYKVIPIGNAVLRVTSSGGAHQSTIQIFKPNGSTAVNLPVKSDRAVSLPTPLVPGVYLYLVNDPAGGITAFSGKFIIR
jgi:WD40 repeat protein